MIPLLCVAPNPVHVISDESRIKSYLGDLEKVLGNLNNTAKVLDTLNALLDSLGVLLAGRVENVLDLVGLALGPLLVCGTTVDGDTGIDGEQAEHDNRLLVDDVKLVANGGNGDTGAGGEDGGLGEEVAAGERVEDALCFLLGGRNVGLKTGLDGREGLLGEGEGGGTRAGGACEGGRLAGKSGCRVRVSANG